MMSVSVRSLLLFRTSGLARACQAVRIAERAVGRLWRSAFCVIRLRTSKHRGWNGKIAGKTVERNVRLPDEPILLPTVVVVVLDVRSGPGKQFPAAEDDDLTEVALVLVCQKR